jgi:hypothetical protein
MKLKYYLRGLGIGIILTTLILTISRVNHKMSDQEIINKAMELGMVMKEDPKGNLYDVLGEESSDTKGDEPTQAPDSDKTPAITPSVTPAEASGDSAGTQVTGTPEENSTEATDPAAGETSDTQTDEQTQDITQPSDTTQITDEQGTEAADNGTSTDSAATDTAAGTEEITFTIEKGMSSGKVSALLESKGLIEEAGDFNNYIIQEDKSGVIRVGTFTVTKGASYQEILKAITSRE